MVSTIISYCSLDRRFIQPNLAEAAKFSSEIIVVCYEHLLNGKKESAEHLEHLKSLAGSKVIVLPWDGSKEPRFYHNQARWIGAAFARGEWLLFLDADEIVEGDNFCRFMALRHSFEFDAATFACFWYFREPIYQSTTLENAGLLLRKSKLAPEIGFSNAERWGYWLNKEIKTLPPLRLPSGPAIHHFSWVRTETEMLEKVSSWAHKQDKDWVTLVRQEFARGFSGTDFVHGYQYRRVENSFSIEI
jgi:hypothetical protein